MTAFLHPKYWFSWIGIGLLWGVSQLPWRWQMAIGGLIGRLLYRLIPKRKTICLKNLSIAYPDKSQPELETLAIAHFESLGKGLFDAAYSWWGNPKKLLSLSHIDGLENLEAALASKQPIIFLSSHFTSLEVSGSIIADRLPSCFVFRPHQNELLNAISISRREARFGKTIAKDNIRGMVRMLKQGTAVWYAPDQQFQGKNHLMVPFFGIDAPSNPATSRLAKLSNALVIPIHCTRDESAYQSQGYTLHIKAPLENFPSDNINNDTLRINQIIEQQISSHAEQYLWTHKRYKGSLLDGKPIYHSS